MGSETVTTHFNSVLVNNVAERVESQFFGVKQAKV